MAIVKTRGGWRAYPGASTIHRTRAAAIKALKDLCA